MKCEKLFTVVFALTLIVSGRASGSCSNATLQGNYGYTIRGFNSSSKPAATVGQITADGKGGLTGVATINEDGVVTSNVATSGSYLILSNCTGTATITPKGGTASNYSVVLDSAEKRIEMVETDSGFTEDGFGLAQGKANCSLAGLKATYGFHGGGFTSSLVPIALDGQVTLDGTGNFTGNETGSEGGTIVSFKIFGTYTVNANCIGTTTGSGKHKSHSYFVVLNAGKSAFEIGMDSGSIVDESIEKR